MELAQKKAKVLKVAAGKKGNLMPAGTEVSVTSGEITDKSSYNIVGQPNRLPYNII